MHRAHNQISCKNRKEDKPMALIDPLTAAAVVARRRLPAASWSSVWYLRSSFAVISYTEN
jgi:hypothetical protein